MDWLEASALFLLGWFGKKLKRFAETVLDTIWFLVRTRPVVRCLIAVEIYVAFLERATALRESGRLQEAALERVKRFHTWVSPKLEAWMERARPGR
jgi:hypothetical protein